MTHKHTKSCRHSKKRTGGKHRHTKKCKHTTKGRKHTGGRKHTKRNHMMKGGISDYPPSTTYPLGVKPPVANFDFNAASYGSSTIPTSQPSAFPFGENSMNNANSMTGGRRRRRHTRRHRGGMGYSFLPPGSELTAKDSYLANVAPYSVYNE